MFDQVQLAAIALATDLSPKNRIVGITGQAGTGKTAITKAVYEQLSEAGWRVVLCAPTGKAAKRISELTGHMAITIHRLLEFSKPSEIDEKTGKPIGKTEPKRNRAKPLELDVVLVDEGAMVGAELFRYLLDALPNGAFIRFFGDVNQLPPVEQSSDPSPFEQLLADRPNVRLTKIYRQSGDSAIPACADLLLKGRIPQSTDDFQINITSNPLLQLKLLIEREPRKWTKLETQLLVPMRERKVGAVALSQLVQDIVNPPKRGESLSLPRNKWQEHTPVKVSLGDKVIQTENDYETEIFNGETGIVLGWDDDNLEVDFGDRKVAIPRAISVSRPWNSFVYCPWRALSLAYCITVHKSQGSEWPEIAIMLERSCGPMLYKNLLYTAVTRARMQVSLISDLSSLQKAVSTVLR
jgi:exodeoxyribonuclease V alpha subunit